jgi:hypothetical protein
MEHDAHTTTAAIPAGKAPQWHATDASSAVRSPSLTQAARTNGEVQRYTYGTDHVACRIP